MPPPRTSFTFALTEPQQRALEGLLKQGNYTPLDVPHTRVAAQGRDCTIALYTSGKCVVQGKGAEEWVLYELEPKILGSVGVGYDDMLHPEWGSPHMGVDESGKGDFFGPLVIAAAYADEELVEEFRRMNVRDSKRITSDRVALELARDIRKLLGQRFSLVTIGPQAYNRLYADLRNVNKILAWGHARCIENLLEAIPDCPRAVSDQFGPTRQVRQALMKKGRSIELVQMPRAESDPAVAAASILARAAFLDALHKLQKELGVEIPKGASDRVRESAVTIVRQRGPEALLQAAKCHFRTTDAVLEAAGSNRAALGPLGAAVSKPRDENG